MSCSRVIFFISCAFFLHASSLIGQTTVAVGSPAKELRRTAHQLRISVEHLRDAREALKQATELARRSPDLPSFSQIAQHWMRLDRAHASAPIEDLYAWVRANARDAVDTGTYQRNLSAAQALLRSLATLDPERALVLWQRWPDPPSSLGEAYRRNQTEAAALFAKQISTRGSNPGPGQLANLTQLREEANRGVYTSVAALAMVLTQSGEKAEALQLVDGAIANFRQREPDPGSLQTYMTFLRQLPNVDSDRYLMGLNSALLAIDKLGAANAGGTLTVGTETVQLTGSEAAVVDLCRGLFARPELAMKTLNSMPGLKSKLDRVGGIDSIVGPASGRSQTPISMNYSIDGRTRTTFNATGTGSMSSSGILNSASGASLSNSMDLYESLRGKLTQYPDLVRRKIDEASKVPDQIDALIQLANRSCYQEPDLASMALEAATKLLPLVDPLQKRASVFQNLMRAFRNCDGEVDAGLLQQGLSLVQQLRDGDPGNVQPNISFRNAAPGMIGMADQLEMAIVAELAVQNFDGALRYVRLMPDELKLQALLRIVQSLMQSY